MESDLQGPSLPQRGYGQHGIDAHPLNVDPAIVDKDTGLEQPVEARANPPVPMSASDRQRAIESLESKKRDLATLNELRYGQICLQNGALCRGNIPIQYTSYDTQ